MAFVDQSSPPHSPDASMQPMPDSASSIGAVPLARYRFLFRNEAPLHLPEHSISIWRGSMGRALKQAICIVPRGRCDHCLLSSRCVYPHFFEQVAAHGAFAAPPRPFVLEYPGATGALPPGSELCLQMVLFGDANAWLPYIVHALEQLGRNGLGRERARLALLAVEQQDEQDNSRWWSILDHDLRRLQPRPAQIPAVPALPPSMRVQLSTPLRIKQQGRYLHPAAFTSRLFLRALHRRWRLLIDFFADGGSPPSLSNETLSGIALMDYDLQWRDWTRWSARQRQEMQLGGLCGHFDLDLRPVPMLWPLLWWGQWAHVGNATSFGLGAYHIELAND